MSLTAAEIIQVMEKAKELGLTSFKAEGIEFAVQPVVTTPVIAPIEIKEVPELKPEEILKPLSVLDQMDDELIQYWATPYYDQLIAQREKQKEQGEPV